MDPVVVTTAGRSGSEDRALRQRRYAITQGIRLLCFILAVALPVPLWAKLMLMFGALVLPWMGVVAANGGPAVERGTRSEALVERPVRIALEPGRDVDQGGVRSENFADQAGTQQGASNPPRKPTPNRSRP